MTGLLYYLIVSSENYSSFIFWQLTAGFVGAAVMGSLWAFISVFFAETKGTALGVISNIGNTGAVVAPVIGGYLAGSLLFREKPLGDRGYPVHYLWSLVSVQFHLGETKCARPDQGQVTEIRFCMSQSENLSLWLESEVRSQNPEWKNGLLRPDVRRKRRATGRFK